MRNFLCNIYVCTANSKINGTPKGFYMPILKLHLILAVPNLLAHNNITISFNVQLKFGTTKIDCSFEMSK